MHGLGYSGISFCIRKLTNAVNGFAAGFNIRQAFGQLIHDIVGYLISEGGSNVLTLLIDFNILQNGGSNKGQW